MSSRELCLRKANFLDSKIIFEWRNEPLVRMNSLHTELIMYDTHLKWFQEKLLSKESQIYICMKGETPVGQIRIDYEGNKGEISYSIASEYRGKGYGKQILELLEDEEREKGRIEILFGVVKYSNLASQKCFEIQSYNREDDESNIYYYKRINRGNTMYIPYGKQSIDEKDIQAVIDVLQSDYLTTGPKVAEFEKKVAEYVGAKYAVAVSNGTAALHIACLAAGIQEGDEVITSPITFAASSNCVLYCGGTPVFADIDEKTYNIDPEQIEMKITDKTKAIIPVHYTGQPCDMDAISAIAKKHNLIVIEDAAHALGASYKGKMIGSMSDMTCFSFHPVKPITTGEGGMVVTNNEKLYKRLLLFRSHGITRDEDMMTENEGPWYYQQLELGYNYRITDISCALGSSQLDKLDSFICKRREIADRYNQAFANIPGIITPHQLDGCNSGWHLYMIQVEHRKDIFNRLRNAGIGVNVHYIPVYKHPYYQKNGYQDCCCLKAEEFYKKAISLPIFPKLTEEEQKYIIDKVIGYVE